MRTDMPFCPRGRGFRHASSRSKTRYGNTAYDHLPNFVAALRLLPMSDCDKDAEILALRHQTMVVEKQLGADR